MPPKTIVSFDRPKPTAGGAIDTAWDSGILEYSGKFWDFNLNRPERQRDENTTAKLKIGFSCVKLFV